MITLSNGVKQPESGEKGAPVFSALNSNAQILNDHTHDGTDSELIDSIHIEKHATTLPTASWVSGARGFSQTVTCPGSVTLDKVALRFRVKSGSLQHQFVHPTVEPTSLTSFVVIVNDSSLELECLFI
jgi:hypothetical protein